MDKKDEPKVGFRDASGWIHGLEDLGVCPKCGGRLFSEGLNYLVTAVQCGDCGEVVAVIKDDVRPGRLPFE